MPCRCDIDFSTYKQYPSSTINEFDVQTILTEILGLQIDNTEETTSDGFGGSPQPLSDRLIKLKQTLSFNIECERELISRVFILKSFGSKPTELYFIPRVDENFHPRKFNNSRGALTHLQKCNQAITMDNQVLNNQMLIQESGTLDKSERNTVLFGRFGKVKIKMDSIIAGVGGLPGLSSPNDAPEYEKDIPKEERCLYLKEFLTGSLINSFTIPCEKLKKVGRKGVTTKQRANSLLESKDVLASIFEFVDTLTLINNVASVCPLFHELIIYDQESSNQIYGGRVFEFCKRNQLQVSEQDVLNFKRFHHNASWLEFYLLSGMVFLEYFKQEICHSMSLDTNYEFGGGYSLKFLILDPTMLVTNNSVLQLISKKRKKIISVGAPNLYTNVTNLTTTPSSQSAIHSILSAPLAVCNRGEVSVNFNKGIPLYVKYLKFLASKLRNVKLLSSTDEHSITKLQYVVEKMVEKAKYFIEQSFNYSFNVAPDDVLLGLHFVLLDNYYVYAATQQFFPIIDYTLLLKNRINPPKEQRACLFPSHMAKDYYSSLLSENIIVPSNHQFNSDFFKTNIFESNSIEEQVMNIQSFIKEHIIELSNVSISDCNVKNYTEFLSNLRDERPTQPVDLLYHFHMLHGIQFYQDTMNLAGCVKCHRLFEPAQEDLSNSPFF